MGGFALARTPPSIIPDGWPRYPMCSAARSMTKPWCTLAASILGLSLSCAACGDGAATGTDAAGADAAGADAANNPKNPAGLGPAAVDLGSATDPAAAGDYVVLAKTGITNVTG